MGQEAGFSQFFDGDSDSVERTKHCSCRIASTHCIRHSSAVSVSPNRITCIKSQMFGSRHFFPRVAPNVVAFCPNVERSSGDTGICKIYGDVPLVKQSARRRRAECAASERHVHRQDQFEPDDDRYAPLSKHLFGCEENCCPFPCPFVTHPNLCFNVLAIKRSWIREQIGLCSFYEQFASWLLVTTTHQTNQSSLLDISKRFSHRRANGGGTARLLETGRSRK